MPNPRPRQQGGVPDSLLLGTLALLLVVTVLTWTATGLSALLSHGSWPAGLTFMRTPLALRHLISHPDDLAGAWPDTPPDDLSGYGLFWGLFIGLLMILLTLTFFGLGTWARWRMVRARKRENRLAARGKAAATGPSKPPLTKPEPNNDSWAFPPLAEGGEGGTGERPPTKPQSPATSQNPPRTSGTRETPPPAPTNPHPLHPTHPTAASQPPPTGPHPLDPAHPAAGSRAARGGTGGRSGTPPARASETPPTPAPTGPAPLLQAAPRDSRLHIATQALQDAPGPALVLTSNPALWHTTKDARAKLGPTLLYDPTHLCDTPSRLHWPPMTGCENKETAIARATALLAPTRPTAKIDQAIADTAHTLLRSYLHAAALEGRTIRHVHRWSQGTHVQEAVKTLRTHPKAAPGAAGELEAALTAHPERRDIAQELTTRTLASLSTVNIREACTPNRTDAVTLDSFIHETGTLYVVGDSIEDPRTNPGAMPLLTALVASVVERGRRMAERSSSGRLDPPLTLILDDVAATAPIPTLPDLLRTGEAQGLPTLALVRSEEQAKSRWPDSPLPF
ncbi:type IV secretory system conjugative DNA transfer family protein [Streptomyces niveiscabiei]|uniref:type IV secretory system conjugative DNA transfer family protein n=1 Tax=Streptomyces niveiscabiei TaxID=164115 RepID=UPI0029B2726B|nr:type IV secretory system conjugative DNA transfer family protein [Streptomyces niveiscabiei]MDX3388073.1 type IV secretory system conjugative DNA transfer family protein [Streptomyces niveiscabiei]